MLEMLQHYHSFTIPFQVRKMVLVGGNNIHDTVFGMMKVSDPGATGWQVNST
jgi:hypothetical protein